MGWYYYSGQFAEPIPVGNGEVVAVRPHTKVFVDPKAESSIELARLRARGVISPCAWPADQKPLAPEAPIQKPEEAVPDTPFAEALLENPKVVKKVSRADRRKAALKKKAESAKPAQSVAEPESDPQGSED